MHNMYVYVCICMYMYISECMFVCTYIVIHVDNRAVFQHLYRYACSHVQYVRTCMRMYVHVCTCMHMYVYVCMYIYS